VIKKVITTEYVCIVTTVEPSESTTPYSRAGLAPGTSWKLQRCNVIRPKVARTGLIRAGRLTRHYRLSVDPRNHRLPAPHPDSATSSASSSMCQKLRSGVGVNALTTKALLSEHKNSTEGQFLPGQNAGVSLPD